jgi:hypothetical protein
MTDTVEEVAIRVIARCHGYSEEEIRCWIDETDSDYDVEIASEVAEITSILRDAFGDNHG